MTGSPWPSRRPLPQTPRDHRPRPVAGTGVAAARRAWTLRTEAVEELIWELRGQCTILIVTHNMAQARRASEESIYMLLGKVVEHGATGEMFVTPGHQETADYLEGR